MSQANENDIKREKPASVEPVFTFRRMSGLDQILLQNDEEWRNLDKLDPQLWMTLSCPTSGLEFSQETLDLLDMDHDGRVRAKEVLDAVSWICVRLRHPAALASGKARLTRDNIRDDTPEGLALLSACSLVKEKHGHPDGESLQLEEIDEVLAEAASYPFNGDGILPPDSASQSKGIPSDGMRDYILTALSIVGGKEDASGKPGLDEALSVELTQRLRDIRQWRASLHSANLPLGEKTGEAWTLLERLGPKFDDYFCRCRLAAYAPDALSRLNDEGRLLGAQTDGNGALLPVSIDRETLLAMPIARASATPVLDLETGINPAWCEDVEKFCELWAPSQGILKKSSKKLDETSWNAIKKNFADYAETLKNKPSWPMPPEDASPVSIEGLPPLVLAPADDPLGRNFLPTSPDEAISALSDAQIDHMLASATQAAFHDLVQKDLAAPPLASFQDLRKLALFHANLYTFLMNYLSFIDFYDPHKRAIFQAGTLYLDSRACLLCVPVSDIAAHAKLAEQSHLCLIYCDCVRKNEDGADEKTTVAAALTMGNLASLIEGRHGLFVDNAAREWDASIVRIVHNPISLREAVWAPYIRISNMISEQVQKFVADKQKAIGDATGKAVGSLTEVKKDAPKPSFDFAKGAGIFAALSVAVSVLSAAFAYIANSVASLGWWWPLALVGIFICVSGPSVILAWFKLRRRSLGPLLDASGWAVNKGAPINFIMGAALTTVGRLPRNARRDLNDPYSLPAQIVRRRRRLRAWLIFWLILLLACAGFAAWCFFFGMPTPLLELPKKLGLA